jgi:hypothetical protein
MISDFRKENTPTAEARAARVLIERRRRAGIARSGSQSKPGHPE